MLVQDYLLDVLIYGDYHCVCAKKNLQLVDASCVSVLYMKENKDVELCSKVLRRKI